jgi:hypothetical protein
MRDAVTRAGLLALIALLAGPVAAFAQQTPGAERTPRDEATATVGPALQVEQTQIDLGRIPEGQEADATFVLENRGTAELRILKAKAG